ncbi:uncharacterized protein LOC144148272 [Haemaphysalis longicornis]
MAKRRTDADCFAPGCHTGYPGAPKASLFAAPRDEDLRKKWERNLRRQDKPLTESSAVCEHHFEKHFVWRDYVHIINGSEVRIPRGKPSLAPDAIPTLLPGCPAYLSVPTAKRRPERKRPAATSSSSENQKPRKQFRDLSNSSTVNESVLHELSQESHSEPLTLCSIEKLALPAKYWCKLQPDGYAGVLFATTTIQKEGKLESIHEKAVCFDEINKNLSVQVFVRCVRCSDKLMSSLIDANHVLRETEEICICKAAMTKLDFTELEQCLTLKLRAETVTIRQSVFSTKCLGEVSTADKYFFIPFDLPFVGS